MLLLARSMLKPKPQPASDLGPSVMSNDAQNSASCQGA